MAWRPSPLEVQIFFEIFYHFAKLGPFLKSSWSNPMTFPFLEGVTLGPLKPGPAISEVISPVLEVTNPVVHCFI